MALVIIAAWWAAVLCVPAVIRRLPEPTAPVLPEPGSPEETALDRALRAEGPKMPYREVGAGGVMVVLSVALAICLGLLVRPIETPRLQLAALGVIPVFVLLTIVDWRTRLLPRVVVLPLAAVTVALAGVEWIVRRDTDALVREFAGGAVAWLIFGLLWFVRRAGMGRGDVRLAFPLGMLMAAVSWNVWLLGLYAAFAAFAVFGVAMMVIARDRAVLKKAYPFGPFMIVGAYAGMALERVIHLIG